MKRPSSSSNNNLGLWLPLFGQSKHPSKHLQHHLRMLFDKRGLLSKNTIQESLWELQFYFGLFKQGDVTFA